MRNDSRAIMLGRAPRMRGAGAAFLTVLVFLLAGIQARAQSSQTLDDQYNESVRDAAVYQHAHVLKLKPLTPNAGGKVTMVTLTSYPYKPGPTSLGVDVWTTIVPEVQNRCKQFPESTLKLDLQKLLGLPTTKNFTNFVVLIVDARDVFRPAPDPSTNTEFPCSDPADPQCGNSFPSSATDAHKAWIAGQSLGSYQIPGGYPWTHLGYTYYWGHGGDIYGASEYVVKKGSTVEVTTVTPYQDYCAGPKTGN